jgi:Arm DNA-binding domain
MPLSDVAVRAIRPRERAYKVHDRNGLFLHVNPSGSKLWRWLLGEYPVVTLAQARDHHLTARKILASGIDPMAERKAEAGAKRREVEALEREAENSFEKVARKWWDWWAISKSKRHTDCVLRRLEADVFRSFGHKSINAVTAADIRNLMLTIEGRGARDVAKRAHETTGQVFRYAIAHGSLNGHSLRLAQSTSHSADPDSC